MEAENIELDVLWAPLYSQSRYSAGGFMFYRIQTGLGQFWRNRLRLWLQAITGVDWTEDTLVYVKSLTFVAELHNSILF